MPVNVQLVSGSETSGTIDAFELEFARRSLRRLKTMLGRDGLRQLLDPAIAKSDEYWRRILDESNGESRVAETRLSTRGLSAKEFLGWFHKIAGDEPTMLAAHPEHYIIAVSGTEMGQQVVETIGEHISAFNIPGLSAMSQVESSPYTMAGSGCKDGQVMGRVAHEFCDHEDGQGFDAILQVWFPKACEDALIETHRRHLAVEFRGWIVMAYNALRNGNN